MRTDILSLVRRCQGIASHISLTLQHVLAKSPLFVQIVAITNKVLPASFTDGVHEVVKGLKEHVLICAKRVNDTDTREQRHTLGELPPAHSKHHLAMGSEWCSVLVTGQTVLERGER